jgi:transposase
MGADPAFPARRVENRSTRRGRFARGVECDPLHGAFGRWVATPPNDFPPWQTVYWWFRRFVRRFMFQTIHDVAPMLDRERAGREASPTGGVVDSQSVKSA